MLEYKMEDTDTWVEFAALNFQSYPLVVGYVLRINGTEYSCCSPKFDEAFRKEKMWEQLSKPTE